MSRDIFGFHNLAGRWECYWHIEEREAAKHLEFKECPSLPPTKIYWAQNVNIARLRNPDLVEHIFVVCNHFHVELSYFCLSWCRNDFHGYSVLTLPGS